MKKGWLMLIMASFCFVAVIGGQRRYSEYVLSTPQGEVKVYEEIGTPSLGIFVDDLLNMVFPPDEIPNYYCTGTVVDLNLGGLLTRLTRKWLHEEHKIRGAVSPFYSVAVDLFVYHDVDEAKKTFHRWSHSTMPEKPALGSVSGIPIGEECANVFPLGGIMFRVGRVIAKVDAGLRDAQSLEDHAYFTEALCLGIEYLLRQHPKVGVLPSKARLLLAGQPNGEVILLHDVPVGKWGVLKGAGVHGKEHRDSKEWCAQLTRGNHWVKVSVFSWEMETERGRVKLERPVFPYKGELIVPLRQVAEALGIVVHQKGQTIALLPK